MTDAWAAVAATLADAGCELVVGVPADEPGLLDAAGPVPGLRAVTVRDQRIGACLATGHTMVSGRPAVLALTSGPPFPNALAGLAEAASLCVPLVVVTTRIPAAGLGRGGFQETDQRSMAASLAKWHHVVESAQQLTWAIRRAVHLAVNGRPGVTIVEVTDEVAQAGSPVPAPSRDPVVRRRAAADPGEVRRAAAVLRTAERPLMIVGGGVRISEAGGEALRVAEALGSPVMTTAAGRGTVPESHPLATGLIGLYATPPLDRLPAEADVVLAIGTRLEETARMGWPESEHVRLVHIDADPHVFGQVLEPEAAVLGDPALVLAELAEALRSGPPQPPRTAWRARIAELDEQVRAEQRGADPGSSAARTALMMVAEVFGERATYVHENGLHDIWSYHYPLLPVGPGTRVVVPGEQTMLGFGLPAAVGAAIALPGDPAVLLCGDGAFAMNLPALVTAAEARVGLVILAFDNSGYGWPRHLRALADEPDEVTRFAVQFPVDDVVRALGGTVGEAGPGSDLRAILRTARASAAAGTVALVRVQVGDDDIPPGIARVMAGHDA
ncbi:thiamine pyrophosphate-binding protein [Actinomadura scrupuli]|uniref:thiamine pyrophosphate-binding protein n=1 Tax=Actinomadura scrupuli TaxID=559629 RepID=UPI003D985B46